VQIGTILAMKDNAAHTPAIKSDCQSEKSLIRVSLEHMGKGKESSRKGRH
jgi:hypothetical protein